MKVLYFLMALVFLASCQERGKSPIEERLNGSDSVVVQFFNEKQVLENAAVSTDLNAIKQLIRFVNGDQTDSLSCPKSGQLIFYKEKKEMVRIIYKTICRQFEFTLNGKKQFTKMPGGAVNYINSIEKGER